MEKGVHFLHADKHLSLYKLVELTRHVQSTQKRNLVIFLQYPQKRY